MALSRRAAVLALAALVAACQSAPPARTARPTLYDDLAAPGAQVDANRALSMINQYRVANGVAPLRLDPELTRIARDYAAVMARTDKMSHYTIPIGQRLVSAGYPAATAGENIAAGYHTLAEAFSGWRESPAHDRGMKDPDMTVMGIGTAYAPNSKYKVFWSLVFARPKTDTPGVGASPTLVSVAGAPAPR